MDNNEHSLEMLITIATADSILEDTYLGFELELLPTAGNVIYYYNSFKFFI